MKKRASEGQIGDRSGIQSLLASHQQMETGDHSPQVHEDTLRKAMNRGQTQPNLAELMKHQVKNKTQPSIQWLARWFSDEERVILNEEMLAGMEKDVKTWAAVIRTHDNKQFALLAKAGRNNGQFTYWVRDCSAEVQVELKNLEEVKKHILEKQVQGGENALVEMVRFISCIELDETLMGQPTYEDYEVGLTEDRVVDNKAFTKCCVGNSIAMNVTKENVGLSYVSAHKSEHAVHIEDVSMIDGQSKIQDEQKSESCVREENTWNQFLVKSYPQKQDLLDEAESNSSFQRKINEVLGMMDKENIMKMEKILLELNLAERETEKSINKLSKEGMQLMSKVFEKVKRTMRRPYPLVPSLESMLFNDSLTPKRYICMNVISSTHRKQNRGQMEDDDETDCDDCMDDDDVMPKEVKEQVKVLRDFQKEDFRQANEFVMQQFMQNESKEVVNPDFLMELDKQVEVRRKMNQYIEKQVKVLQESVMIVNQDLGAQQQAWLQELWCLSAIELDAQMAPLDSMHTDIFRHLWPESKMHFEQSTLGFMLLTWNSTFSEQVSSQLNSVAIALQRNQCAGNEGHFYDKEQRQLRKLHFAIMDFWLTVENIKHVDQNYKEDMFKGVENYRNKIISATVDKGNTKEAYEHIKKVLDESMYIEIMRKMGVNEDEFEDEFCSMEESRFKRQK